MCPTGTSILTTTKKTNLRSAFDVMDKDGDGKISHDDLRAFYNGYSGHEGPEEDVIGSMIYAADSNRNGFVEYDEFEKVLDNNNNGGTRKNERSSINGVMEDAFKVMDKDGDGLVGLEDLKSYLSWAGLGDVRDEDVKAMIRLGGGGDEVNGGVTFEGLLKILSV